MYIDYFVLMLAMALVLVQTSILAITFLARRPCSHQVVRLVKHVRHARRERIPRWLIRTRIYRRRGCDI